MIKKILAILCVLVSFVIISIGIVNAVPPKNKLLPSDYATKIEWDKAITKGKPIAVNFYVDWCTYCKKFAPILDDLRKEYEPDLTFVMINAEERKNIQLVKDFMIGGFPSFYLYEPEYKLKVFISQGIYANPKQMRQEIDTFLNVSKKLRHCEK